MKIQYRTIWSFLILGIFSQTISGQSMVGDYKAYIKKSFKFFGLMPHFHSSGALILNPDSTYQSQTNWESFSNFFNGTWEVFNDTLVLYSNGKDLNGNEILKNYAYSYGHSNSIINEIGFGIYDLQGQRIPSYKAKLYIRDSVANIKFDNKGLFNLHSDGFDSLVITTDKYFKYQQIKISMPVCCKINAFGITPAIRYFLLDNKKIKNLAGHTLYKKKQHKP